MINLNNIKQMIHNNKVVKSISHNGNIIWQESSEDIIYNTRSAGSAPVYQLNKETGKWEDTDILNINQININSLWTDGKDLYANGGESSTSCLKYDKSTKTWNTVTWTGLTDNYLDGRDVWTDGNNIYYDHYVGSNKFDNKKLDKTTMTWVDRSTEGEAEITYGSNVWTDGINVFNLRSSGGGSYAQWDPQLELFTVPTVSFWSDVISRPLIEGSYVWFKNDDPDYAYVSNGTKQYKINLTTHEITYAPWSGGQIVPESSGGIWTDGTDYYYFQGSVGTYASSNARQYKLVDNTWTNIKGTVLNENNEPMYDLWGAYAWTENPFNQPNCKGHTRLWKLLNN